MHLYKIVPFLKLLIQARGMPLHFLSRETDISEDRLLDILSGRSNVTTPELDALCEVLRSSEIAAGIKGEWRMLAPSVQERLERLRTLDQRLIDCIREFHDDRSAPAEPEIEKAVGFDRDAWRESLDQLKHVYESYHADIRTMLDRPIPPTSRG